MNSSTLKLTLIIFNLCLFSITYGQAPIKNTKHNTVYATLGLTAQNINYERRIAGNNDARFFTSYWAKASYGRWVEPFGSKGRYSSLGLSALTGSKNNHIELGIGLTSFFDLDKYNYGVSDALTVNGGTGIIPSKSEYRFITPSGGIGYRFQKPNGRFIFRSGLGFPEAVYVSVGFCF